MPTTETETLANSSIFNLLKPDSRVLDEQLPRAGDLAMTTVPMPESAKLVEQKSDEVLTMVGTGANADEDPEMHFKKLKAKIKLKAVKKYHEDLVRKEEEEKRANEPVLVIKDRFGRVMEKRHPLMSNKKEPNATRMPRRRPSLKRKTSFSAQQLQFDDYVPVALEDDGRPSLVDQIAIDEMKRYKRFPIPEALMHRPAKKSFKLTLDSILREVYSEQYVHQWAEYQLETGAPCNSAESEDDYNLY